MPAAVDLQDAISSSSRLGDWRTEVVLKTKAENASVGLILPPANSREQDLPNKYGNEGNRHLGIFPSDYYE